MIHAGGGGVGAEQDTLRLVMSAVVLSAELCGGKYKVP